MSISSSKFSTTIWYQGMSSTIDVKHAFVILCEEKIEYLWGILYNQHCMIVMVRSDVDVPIMG